MNYEKIFLLSLIQVLIYSYVSLYPSSYLKLGLLFSLFYFLNFSVVYLLVKKNK